MILWNDLTAVPIVTTVNAAEAERFAAEELRSYLSRISGRTFKIRTAPGPDIPAILVGRDACISAGLVPDPDLTDDGFVIDCDDRRLCITGIHPRGTLYGVYAFLEDCLGCRFFSPEVETIPCLEAFALSPVHIRKVPVLEYRFRIPAPGSPVCHKARDQRPGFPSRSQNRRPRTVRAVLFCAHLLPASSASGRVF